MPSQNPGKARLQVQCGALGGLGAARIDHDQLQAAASSTAITDRDGRQPPSFREAVCSTA